MLITDTGPLVALLNSKDKHHAACADLFSRYRQPIIIPAPVVTEVAQFLEFEPGPQVEAAFLEALARRELLVEATTPADFARMAHLVRKYADFPLGTADASVIAVAERLGITKVATIDREHFSAVKPAHCDTFELLPTGLIVEKRPRKAKRSHSAKR
jgi:predicted nucleic acid-binding protein